MAASTLLPDGLVGVNFYNIRAIQGLFTSSNITYNTGFSKYGICL